MLNIAAAVEVDSSSGQQKRARWSASQTTQHASDIAVGGNLQADAGRDLAIIASTVKAIGNLALSAAANESYSSAAEIPGVVMRAVSEGKLVGYQGSGVGRPIYEIKINDQTQRIAVTVGDNGLVVGANPRGSVK
ncbi:hemagglutinin repeat-containing protein [Pseudomonas sp. nanlin1]|uniref:hemagglutinin repeat-containing protein n=1 Tax=Pseudomonas sp. nanlin1 TaxID=3040605 RepID=UPI0038900105